MSGLKPIQLTEFYRQLHGRGQDTTTLAKLTGLARPTVSRILNGARRRGPSWAKIARHLTPAEIKLLDVAHSSTWNTARRPRWTPEKSRQLRTQPSPVSGFRPPV